jgi:hypothetical protein
LSNNQDKSGKNSVHYVVNPREFGSFENTEILKALFQSGIAFNMQHKDKHGKTPQDYAAKQKSGQMT